MGDEGELDNKRTRGKESSSQIAQSQLHNTILVPIFLLSCLWFFFILLPVLQHQQVHTLVKKKKEGEWKEILLWKKHINLTEFLLFMRTPLQQPRLRCCFVSPLGSEATFGCNPYCCTSHRASPNWCLTAEHDRPRPPQPPVPHL